MSIGEFNDIREEELMSGGYFGNSAALSAARKTPFTDYLDETAASGFDADDIEHTLADFIAEIISDVMESTGKCFTPEETCKVVMNPHIVHSIFVNYVNSTGNLEDRLKKAIINAIPINLGFSAKIVYIYMP